MLVKLPNLPQAVDTLDLFNTERPIKRGKRAGRKRRAVRNFEECIAENFGSFENFKHMLTQTAVAGQGQGWTILVWSPFFRDLEIVQTDTIESLDQWGVVPLLAVNNFQHKHSYCDQEGSAPHVMQWWDFVDWEDVRKRFKEITKSQNLKRA